MDGVVELSGIEFQGDADTLDGVPRRSAMGTGVVHLRKDLCQAGLGHMELAIEDL